MFRTILCSALLSLPCLLADAAVADQPRLQQGGWSSVPRLGFQCRMLYGRGLMVHSVSGSLADQLGLEYGDVIVQVNDVPIRSMSDYDWALRNCGGRVRLLVQDVNGHGRLWTQTAYLNNGAGPIVNRSEAP